MKLLCILATVLFIDPIEPVKESPESTKDTRTIPLKHYEPGGLGAATVGG